MLQHGNGKYCTAATSLRRREVTLARISLYIVFVFFICHTVRLLPNTFEMIQTYMEVSGEPVNFLVICIKGVWFRIEVGVPGYLAHTVRAARRSKLVSSVVLSCQQVTRNTRRKISRDGSRQDLPIVDGKQGLSMLALCILDAMRNVFDREVEVHAFRHLVAVEDFPTAVNAAFSIIFYDGILSFYKMAKQSQMSAVSEITL